MLSAFVHRARAAASNALARITTPERASLESMVLPNGRFVLVLSGVTRPVDATPELLADLQDQTGAAAFLVFADPLTVLDADVLPAALGEVRDPEEQS